MGNAARLVPMVAGEDVGTALGVYRGDAVDVDDVKNSKNSMMIPKAVLPVGAPESL